MEAFNFLYFLMCLTQKEYRAHYSALMSSKLCFNLEHPAEHPGLRLIKGK